MKRIYTHIPRGNVLSRDINRKFKTVLLSPLYLLLAYLHRTPGILFHAKAVQMFLTESFNTNLLKHLFYSFKNAFIDSVRYFEFDFFWKSITPINPSNNYLDISSPRLFSAIALFKNPSLEITMVNPDICDIKKTISLMDNCGFTERCTFINSLIDDIVFPNESFDIITSISVIEHIVEDGDTRAVRKMWNLLKPGGHLLLSVPCAHECFEEFIDINEYGLLVPDKNNFVFGQRFYDEQSLRDRIFIVTGYPHRFSVFGENQKGLFQRNREEKNSNPDYPIWKEPLIVRKKYSFFESVGLLPGWGVIAMDFYKH